MWARFDDGYPDHPKVQPVSDAAFRVHVRAVCYASRYLTDGAVPNSFFAGHETSLEELVSAGLIDRPESGPLLVHDFLEYNPSKASVLRERKAVADRKERWKERRSERVPHGVQNGEGTLHPSSSSSSSSSPAAPSELSPSPAAPARKKRTIDPAKRTTAQRVWDLYAAMFFVSCGQQPVQRREWFISIAGWLAQGITGDGIAARLKVYFESPPFVCREGSRDFGRFVKFFDQLAVPANETASELLDRMLASFERAKHLPGSNGTPPAIGDVT